MTKGRCVLSLISLFALLSLFVVAPSAHAIYGGGDATGSPVVVFVRTAYSIGQTGDCSGTLIEAQIVVTAAHCLYDNTGNVSSTIGVCSPGVDVSVTDCMGVVTKVFIPPGFNLNESVATRTDDIAFLTIRSPLARALPIVFADTPQMAKILTDNTLLYVVGYGRSDPSSAYTASTPRSGSLNVNLDISNLIGRSFIANFWPVSSKYYDFCAGDSGAPVLLAPEVGATQVTMVGIMTTGDVNNCGVMTSRGYFSGGMMQVGPYMNLWKSAQTYLLNSVPVPKKSSIICQKGTLLKKVTAVKPVCPKGYVKKFNV